MEEKICKECGGILRYDRDKKMFQCAYCGRTTAANEENLDVSIESVEKLISEGRYTMAESMVKDLLKNDPDNPRLLYNKILCYYQDKSVAAILVKYKKNTKKLKAIKAMTEWRILADKLPEEKRSIVGNVGHYIDVALELCEVKTNVGESINRNGKSPVGIKTGRSFGSFWDDIINLYVLSADSEEEYSGRVSSADVFYDDQYLASNKKKQKKTSDAARDKRDSLEAQLDRLTSRIRNLEKILWTEKVLSDEDLDNAEIDIGPESKICPKCASPLRYDRTNKFLLCSYCGWKQPYDHEEMELTIGEIDKLLNDRAFAKAKPLIKDMLDRTPFDPQILLRYIYCTSRAADMRNLLETRKDDPEKIAKLLEFPEWEIIESHLPENKRDLVTFIRLYFEISEDLSDNLMSLGNAKKVSGVSGKNDKPSAFSKMDEEFEKEQERQAMREQVNESSALSEIGAFFRMIGEDLDPFEYDRQLQRSIQGYSPEYEEKCAEDREIEKKEVTKAKRDLKVIPQKRELLKAQQDEVMKKILERLEYLS